MNKWEKVSSSAGGEEYPNNEIVPAEVVEASDKGLINKIRKLINGKVSESILPTKEGLGYESTLGIYGGKLVKDDEGNLVYDTRGLWSKVDRWGDRLLRAFDEHQAKKPGKILMRHPGFFLKHLPFIADSRRFRGTPEQTVENAKRLGLEKYYGLHPWGVQIKDPALYAHAYALTDIYHQDEINHPALSAVDRFQALGAAASYVRHLHEFAGGVGETNVAAFLFAKKEGEKVEEPLIAISSLTEIYNPEKNISDIEKKATDMLDLFVSCATEEYRRSKDWDTIRRSFEILLDNYAGQKVIAMVASYAKRGRLTLAGDADLSGDESAVHHILREAFAAHNTQRLSVKNPEVTAQIRQEIIDACERYLDIAAKDAVKESK